MNIKTIFSILTICFAFASVTSAQDKFAKAISQDEFVTSHEKGLFTFELPEDITAKDVELSAEFYTVYFTVVFNKETHLVNIKLQDNEDRAVQVMGRFFISLGIREIRYMEKKYTIEEFHATYLRDGKKGK